MDPGGSVRAENSLLDSHRRRLPIAHPPRPQNPWENFPNPHFPKNRKIRVRRQWASPLKYHSPTWAPGCKPTDITTLGRCYPRRKKKKNTPDFRNSGFPDFRNSGFPKIRKSEFPEFRKSGNSEIPNFRISENPDFRISGFWNRVAFFSSVGGSTVFSAADI